MKLHKPRTYYRLLKAGILGNHVLWEPKVMKTMRKVNGRLFVDIGANEGIYSLALQKHFKTIIAFEPNPQFYERLKLNVPDNCEVYPFAISDKNGFATLFLDDTPNRCSGSADTILQVFEYRPPSKPDMEKVTFQNNKGIQVETRRLDNFFYIPIDLLKVDVEGAEFLVLEGAEKLLIEKKILRLMIELHDRDRKKELEEYLGDFGYKGTWVDADHYYAIAENS